MRKISLTSLQHGQGETALAGYDFTYDAASRISTIDSLIDGLTTYSYDTTNQLTGADFATQTDETHAWDANGNPDEETATVGPNNQVLSDGTYTYQYDGEGNRTRRVNISDGTSTEYQWDHRNRLTDVIDKDAGGNETQAVHYAYDFVDRWIGRTFDDDGDGEDAATSQWFAFDGNQVILSFDDPEATAPDHRYLNGPAVDQYFADENSENDVLLLLGDHLGTIRDTALVNSGTGDTELKNHTTYSSFNARLNDTDSAFASLIGETGRPHDSATGLDNHLHRWLDAALKRWLSEDPSTFKSGDSNLSREMGNRPVSGRDPTGLFQQQLTDALREKYYDQAIDILTAMYEKGQISLEQTIIRSAIVYYSLYSHFKFNVTTEWRNPKYWEQRTKGSSFTVRSDQNAGNAIMDTSTTKGYSTGCYQVVELLQLRGILWYSNIIWMGTGNRTSRDWFDSTIGTNPPSDVMSNFVVVTEGNFTAKDFLPGDMAWMKNPYFYKLSKDDRKKFPGEEGATVVAIGNGLFVSYTGKTVYDTAGLQSYIKSTFESVPEDTAKLGDFTFQERGSPITPPIAIVPH